MNSCASKESPSLNMDDTNRPQAGFHRNNSHLTMEGEGRSSSTSRSSLFEEILASMDPSGLAPKSQAKAHRASSFNLRPAKDVSAWPGNTEKKTVSKDRGLSGDLPETIRNSGQSGTAMLRHLATGLERMAEMERKRRAGTDAGTSTVAKSSTTANTVSGQDLFGTPSGFKESTFSRPNPFDLEAKQPAPSRDATAHLDLISTSSPIPSQVNPFSQTCSTHVGSRANQRQESTTVLSDDPSAFKPREAASSDLAHEAGLTANPFAQSSHSDRGLQPDRQACLSSETVHSQPSRATRRMSNRPLEEISRLPLLGDSEGTIKALRPDTLIRSVEKEVTQFISVTGAERPSPLYSGSHQLRSQVSSPAVGYRSPPSMFSDVPSPKIKIHLPETMDGKDGSHIPPLASSPAAPYTPLPSATTPNSVEEESDDYYESSPPIKEESASEDDSCSPEMASPSRGRRPRSDSTTMIRNPSPGSLNVIWKWVVTGKRERTLPTFFWIVQTLSADLGSCDLKNGFIYAFKAKEPEGRNYLKIGYTDRIGNRMNAHKKCYGEIERVYPPQEEIGRNIRHVHRVERLIHAELVQQSMLLKNCPCNSVQDDSHREWFDVDERHAIAVIERWSEWIMTRPYKEVPLTPKKTQDTKKKEPATTKKKEATPTKKKEPATTVWQLWARDRESIMEMCWPLDMSATMMDH